MERKNLTIDISLDEDHIKRIEEIIEGNRLQLDINSEEDLKKICKAIFYAGIITESSKVRDR